MYDCTNSVLLFNLIGDLFIHYVPYFLQRIDDLVIWNVPRVGLPPEPQKECRDEMFTPAVLFMDAIGQILVAECELSAFFTTWLVPQRFRHFRVDFYNTLTSN